MIPPASPRRAAPLAAAIASLALAGALAGALGGCVTLFPKETPATLYRFGEDVPAAAASGPGFAVRLVGFTFDPAAGGDQIMTVTGDEVAYVGDGRWVSPASTMFSAAVRKGFAGGSVRLLEPGEAGQAPLTMRLTVSRFEADYDHGAGAAPTVQVTLRATLSRTADQSLVDAKEFDVSMPAGDNRLGPITDAFDKATNQAVSQLVGWVDEKGGGA
ncbi:MAG TPA: ABC-type transport auxiliary lipoprotein family protein [Caulobacteraceae bacterium]|nr:ABC-type transport auxiliary lipoprotein family protein [Caulobacteraceae bacterium]